MEAVVFCLLILNEKYSLETVSKAKRRELKIIIPILSIAPTLRHGGQALKGAVTLCK